MEDLIPKPHQPRRRKWAKRRVPVCIRLDVEQARQVKRLSGKLKISMNQVYNDAVAAMHRSVFDDASAE